MKKICILLSVLVLVFAVSCGGGSGIDPLAPGSGAGLSPGASMANSKVDSSIQYIAFQAINEEIVSGFAKGIKYVVTSAPDPPLRIVGKRHGSSIITENDSTTMSPTWASNLTLTYENYYSDSGNLYLLGELRLVGQWAMEAGNTVRVRSCFVYGTINVSGSYGCSIVFDRFSIIMDGDGEPQDLPTMVAEGPTCHLAYDGTITLTNEDGSKLLDNPYRFDSVGCEF